MDGLDVAREIRKKSSTPILILTARVEEADQLVGLELGADDYVTKPFSPRLVVARVRALLRRSEAASTPARLLHVGDLEIDLEAHIVTQGNTPVDLTPTEFNLLAALAEQPGRVFSRLQLLETSQGTTYEGYERTIDAHIKNLRAKIEPDPKKPQYIETVFGVGYRFSKTISDKGR
jgi:DNA-binding response OmpR family regulator